MCKLREAVSAILLLSGLLLNPAEAALVELVVTGNIDTTNGAVRPASGSSVTVKAVYNTDYIDTDLSSSTGRFYDIAGNTTSLISIGVTTDLGTVNFTTSDSSQSTPPIVTQIQVPGLSQSLDTSTISATGFTGSLGSITNPSLLKFVLGDADLGQIFTDPNVLLSANTSGPLDLSQMFGYVAIQDVLSGASSEMSFSATSYSVSAVPLPASAWLLGSGLIGFFGLARCKPA